jgi:hypothetical protein
MATKLDPNELVNFKELLIANEVYMEAFVQLLVDNGILTRHEILGRVKQVQLQMLENRTRGVPP